MTYLDNVLTDDPVIVYEVSDGPSDGRLSPSVGLPVNEGEAELVLVVVLLHVGGGLPGGVRVQTSGVLLHHDHEYSLLLEGCVEGEDAHENEVRRDASNEDRSGEGERVEKVPGQSEHCRADSHTTDEEPAVLQTEVLLVGELVSHHFLDGVIQGVLDGGPVPLVHLDSLLHLGSVLTREKEMRGTGWLSLLYLIRFPFGHYLCVRYLSAMKIDP